MHVGLNLIFLVPGETGGMEVAARETIPALVAAAPPGTRFTAFVNRDAGPARGTSSIPQGRGPGARRESARMGARRAAAAAAARARERCRPRPLARLNRASVGARSGAS